MLFCDITYDIIYDILISYERFAMILHTINILHFAHHL